MPAHRRYTPTERIDDMLKQIYALATDRKVDRRGLPTVRQFAKRIGWTAGNLYKRARELGISRPRDCGRKWTVEEEMILERNAHYSEPKIQRLLKERGFLRSRAAIHGKLKRTKYHLNTPYQSAHQVATALGYAQTMTVLGWIKRGLLKARESDRYGKSYLIKDEDIRAFILSNPMMIDLRKVDQLWFFEVMFPGKVGMTVREALKDDKPSEYSEESEDDDEPIDEHRIIESLVSSNRIEGWQSTNGANEY